MALYVPASKVTYVWKNRVKKKRSCEKKKKKKKARSNLVMNNYIKKLKQSFAYLITATAPGYNLFYGNSRR